MSINKVEIWKDRISECKTSGLPVTEWCRKNELTKAKYYYWHKIINESAMPPTENPVFAEVVVPLKVSSYLGIKVSCKDVDISLSDTNDITLAVAFIQELQKQC